MNMQLWELGVGIVSVAYALHRLWSDWRAHRMGVRYAALETLRDAAGAAVNTVYTEMVRKWKLDAENGKLSPTQRREASDTALRETIATAKARGIRVTDYATISMLRDLIESSVAARKQRAD